MKKYLLGILAMALAISLSAFTTPEKKSNESVEWFEYIPGGLGGPSDPNNYVYKTVQAQSCFFSNFDLCEVEAQPLNPTDPPASHKPDLTTDTPHYRN